MLQKDKNNKNDNKIFETHQEVSNLDDHLRQGFQTCCLWSACDQHDVCCVNLSSNFFNCYF